MTNDEREALIKKAAQAIRLSYAKEMYTGMGFESAAEAALAVFEQAYIPTAHPAHSGHEYGGGYARAAALAAGDPDWMNATGGTPTDDERGGCGCMTRQVRYVDGEWARELELIPCETHRRPVQAESYDEGTLAKVYDALHGAGYRRADIEDIVNAMQNAGILFRERRPVQGSGNSAQNSGDEREALIGMLRAMPELVEEDIAEVILAAGFRRPVRAEPTEVDADPDTAFELGRVAGYDEAMREVQAEPTDSDLIAWHVAQVETLRPFRRSAAHFEASMMHASTVAALRAALKDGESRG